MQDNDLISRAAAKEAVRNSIRGGATELVRVFKEIDKVPAVDAARVRHGRWIEDRTHIMCSVCGARYKDEIVFMPDACMSGQIYDGLEHCPHCGVLLNGGDDSATD